MKINLVIILSSLILCSLLSCSDDDCLTCTESLDGTYSYTSYDSTGIAIVTGEFNIEVIDTIKFKGIWNFEKIGNPENIGPQVGNGNLVGELIKDDIWIELNPGNADNNLQLIGSENEGIIEGEWMWISFIGITNKGKFEAERK